MSFYQGVILSMCAFAWVHASEIANETWQPSQHPAVSHRLMTSYSQAIHRMEIAPLVSGRISSINIDVGDICDQKSHIQIDPTLPRIDLTLARQRLTKGETAAIHSQARLEIAQAEFEFQSTEHKRILTLQKRGITSDEKVSTSTLANTRAQLMLQAQKLALEQAQLQIAILEQHVKRAQYFLDNHNLILPQGWTVSKRHLQKGSFAAAGQGIISLSDIRTLIVHLSLSEDEIKALQQQNIELHFTQEDVIVVAKIKSISPDFIAHSRKRDVTLIFPATALGDNASGGLSCTLDIQLLDAQHMRIPHIYIENRFGQNRVRDTTHTWHPIVISRLDDKAAIIAVHQLPTDIQLIITTKSKND